MALIWAQSRHGIIGQGGAIPWHLPEDLAHFRSLTDAGTVVMGRRTWDSLPDRFRPLPGRRNIVVTRDAGWASPGAEAARSVEAAVEAASVASVAWVADSEVASAAAGVPPIWVIGGGDLYAQFLPLATRVEITEVDLDVAGDTRAPAVDSGWETTSRTDWMVSRAGIRYRFVGYRRQPHGGAGPIQAPGS